MEADVRSVFLAPRLTAGEQLSSSHCHSALQNSSQAQEYFIISSGIQRDMGKPQRSYRYLSSSTTNKEGTCMTTEIYIYVYILYIYIYTYI